MDLRSTILLGIMYSLIGSMCFYVFYLVACTHRNVKKLMQKVDAIEKKLEIK
jgi:hypothetical protein